MDSAYDVIVVGGGNAAMCAALSAREHAARVLVLERAPQEERGGNSAFTGAGFRFVYNGIDDIKQIVTDLSAEEIAISDYGAYTAEQYFDDMGRVTQYQCDPDLTETLVRSSTDTVRWLCKAAGVRFVPKYGVSAVKHDGRWKFNGGSVIWVVGGGRGLVDGQ
jgi:tricarballylate dehydrogenase